MEGVNLPIAGVRLRNAQQRLLTRIHPARLAWMTLGVLLVAAGALVLYSTRGNTAWFDEWIWILGRRGNSIGTFLHPHNSHLSLVPIAIYRLLFATVGLRHYVAYRLILVLLHLGCGTLVFVYATRRVGPYLALLVAAMILFLGPGWQDILWPFQIAWLISICSGIGGLLLLERHDGFGDVGACILLLVSLGSSGIGVPIAVGAAVEVFVTRRRAELWIVAIPLALYVLWAIGYQNASIPKHDFVATPSFVATAAAAAFAALFGLSGDTLHGGPGTLITWGAPLAIVAVALVGWRLVRLGRLPMRAGTLLVVLFSFWLLTAIGRAYLAPGYDSRYLYVSSVFIVLLTAELARGVKVNWLAAAVLGVIAAGAVVSNIAPLRAAGRFLHSQSQVESADLGALDIARNIVPASYRAAWFPGATLLPIIAGQYFAAERDLGTPATSISGLSTASEDARMTADAELIHAHRLTLSPSQGALAVGVKPVVDTSTGGTVSSNGSCVTFASAFSPGAAFDQIQVTIPPSGVVVAAKGAPASIAIRRFAGAFTPLGTLPPSTAGKLQISRDLAMVPWHLQATTSGRVTLCGLA